MRERRRWPTGALVAASAAVGLLVGLRSIAALDLGGLIPLLDLDTVPRESFGIAWTERASWPADAQTAAWRGLVGALAALFAACLTVATLNAVVLLAEASASRSREMAIRAALGASPWSLARRSIAELRTLVAAGGALGLLTGLGGGVAARAAWPDGLRPLLDPLPLDLAAGASVIAAALVAAHTASSWSFARRGRMGMELRAGARATADPAAIFVRKSLAAVHVTVAASVLAITVTLSRLPDPLARVDAASTKVVALASTPTGGWARALEALRDVPTLEAESLAAPGALLGLGVRDIAITECGACSRGGLPAPLWNALADHHVVAPGYFALTDMQLAEGRDFTASDEATAPRVAIVNRTFANTSFEEGRPLGKRIRVGRDLDDWYTVVGIVEDAAVTTLGTDGVAREAVYLSALQRPPERARVLLRGDEAAVAAAHAALAGLGAEPTAPVSLTAWRNEGVRALRWARGVASALALLALLLAAHGTFAVALQTTRRRGPDLAVRRAVGASTARIVLLVAGERLRVTGWGLAGFGFFGLLALAVVQNTSGLEGPGPVGYGGIAALLAALSLAASVRAAREAISVEPRRLLD